MSDLISRQAAIDIAKELTITIEGYEMHNQAVMNYCAEIIQLPPIQPVNNSENPNSLDCISRQAAINAIDKCYCGGEDSCGEPWIYKENAVEAIQMIEPIPSAEPKKGRWISADAMFHGVPFYCSECGENTRDTVMGKPRWNFCPNCGAKMEVTE